MVIVVTLLICLTAARIGLSTLEKRGGERAPRLRALGETMEVAIIAVCAVFLVIRPFCAQAFYIPSGSMAPTLQVNDRLLVNKLAYLFGSPQRNEIVVFRGPASGKDEEFVKRIVGLPGDVVEVRSGSVWVNGAPLGSSAGADAPSYDMSPFPVPDGKLFVLGDNRNDSSDSHHWGALDRKRVIGRAVFVFWPPSRLGTIR